jgi:hypothetical protein
LPQSVMAAAAAVATGAGPRRPNQAKQQQHQQGVGPSSSSPQQQQQQQEGQQQQQQQQRAGRQGGSGGDSLREPVRLSESSPMYLPVLTDEDLDNDPPGHKSGYVAVIGRPNAGGPSLKGWSTVAGNSS